MSGLHNTASNPRRVSEKQCRKIYMESAVAYIDVGLTFSYLYGGTEENYKPQSR
jgi:hypothetical protein